MKLVYFAWIREQLDRTEESIDLPENIRTIADLLEWQRSRGEEFDAVFKHGNVIRVAVNQEHVDERSTPIGDAGEIAFFPPMTGG